MPPRYRDTGNRNFSKLHGSILIAKFYSKEIYRSADLSNCHVCQKVNVQFIARIVTEAADLPNNRFIYRNLRLGAVNMGTVGSIGAAMRL